MQHRGYDRRPSHPYNAGTEHVGFSPTKQTLHQERSAVIYSANRMKEKAASCSERLMGQTSIWMTASMS